jgi:uncharacterized protein (DUF58 family)
MQPENRRTADAPHAPFRYLPAALAEAVQRLAIRVRRPVRGRGEGLHRSPDFGASVEFAEYREYTPGDLPARIDWAVYARTDRYLVRRFEEETSLQATLALDTSGSLGFRDAGPLTKLEFACYLAAGLTYALTRQGDAAGLCTFTDRVERHLPPAATLTGLRPLLEALETLEARGRSDIGTALQQIADRLPARSLVIVISDFLQEADRIVRGLRRLDHDGHNLILLHVIDGGERALGFAGVTELREIETGRRLVADVDDVRTAYTRAVERHIETLRRAASDCLGDYHLLDTREPVEAALRRAGARPV